MTANQGTGPISRRFDAWIRSFAYYRGGRSTATEPILISEHPEADERVEHLARRVGWALSIVAPLLSSAALVAVRENIDRSTGALVLVLPVVLVAIIGGPGPAALASVASPLAFDVLLTRPYYRLEIDAVEDVEATLILLVIGSLVGQLVARETRSRVRSEARLTAVQALLSMINVARNREEEAVLAERAVASLRELLQLRDCRWSPGYHGAAHPLLAPDGAIVDAATRASVGQAMPSSGTSCRFAEGTMSSAA